jgi:hypothetical protein
MKNHKFFFIALFVAASAAFIPAQGAPAEEGATLHFRADAESELLAGYEKGAAPSAASQEGAAARLKAYAAALGKRDFASAYAMMRLSFQAANPRVDWEMSLKDRGDLWASGRLQILRSSWTRNPMGQPAGDYVAYDFLGNRTNGDFDCGYIVLHQPTENAVFSVVRTEANHVPAEFVVDGAPQPEVLGQLPCFLGNALSAKR